MLGRVLYSVLHGILCSSRCMFSVVSLVVYLLCGAVLFSYKAHILCIVGSPTVIYKLKRY